MANLAHPIDGSLADLSHVRRKIIAAFMEDHRLTEVERATLAAFDEAVGGISDFRARERLADLWLKGGNLDSRYGEQAQQDAGVRIVRLEVAPKRSRVIRIKRHDDDGPRAA